MEQIVPMRLGVFKSEIGNHPIHDAGMADGQGIAGHVVFIESLSQGAGRLEKSIANLPRHDPHPMLHPQRMDGRACQRHGNFGPWRKRAVQFLKQARYPLARIVGMASQQDDILRRDVERRKLLLLFEIVRHRRAMILVPNRLFVPASGATLPWRI